MGIFIFQGKSAACRRKDWDARSVGIEIERKAQHLSLQVPLRSHSSSSSDENSSCSAALPLLAGEKDSPSSAAEETLGNIDFPPRAKSQESHRR